MFKKLKFQEVDFWIIFCLISIKVAFILYIFQKFSIFKERPNVCYSHLCYEFSTSRFSQKLSLARKKTWNMYFNKIHNFCSRHFSEFPMVLNINLRIHDFYGFFMVSPWKLIIQVFSLLYSQSALQNK